MFVAHPKPLPKGSLRDLCSAHFFSILYANDIVDVIKHCKLALYADDTVLYTACSNHEVSERKMKKDFLAPSRCCNSNGIRMNTDKTKLMWIGSAKKLKDLPQVTVNVDGSLLQSVTSYKYLGVTLDAQLNYGKHISNLIAVASAKLTQFPRTRSFLSKKAAMLVYKSMLLPLLEYGNICMLRILFHH